jgi:hypothetical protein
MKDDEFAQTQKPVAASQPTAAANSNKNELDFVPAPDEAAGKGFLSHVNQGSPSGHEARHWLAAEAKLITERNRVRVQTIRHPK